MWPRSDTAVTQDGLPAVTMAPRSTVPVESPLSDREATFLTLGKHLCSDPGAVVPLLRDFFAFPLPHLGTLPLILLGDLTAMSTICCAGLLSR